MSEQSPFTGQGLLAELNPTIEQAYTEHMANLRGTPINPIQKLHDVASTYSDPDSRKLDNSSTPDNLVYGPILRQSFNERVEWLKDGEVDVRPALEATFLMGLLTEDNLPHYSVANYEAAHHSEPLRVWLHEWISEEDSHGELMRDYGLLAGVFLDKTTLATYQTERVSQLRSGISIRVESPAQGFSYLSLQEMATYISHKNTGLVLDALGRKAMQAISGDEFNHFRFYEKLIGGTKDKPGLLDIDPDNTVIEVRDQITNFEMPGKLGIKSFNTWALKIALAGLFDEAILNKARRGIVEGWNITDRKFKSDVAKRAQEDLITAFKPDTPEAQKSTARLNQLREHTIARARAAGKLLPFIIGHTVEIIDNKQLRIIPQ